MSVLLLILKVIGIILLALLGFLLLLAVLALFVPVRYRITGVAEDEARIQGQLTWLFPVLGFRFSYEKGEFTQVLRIFGIRKKEKSRESRDEFEEEEAFEEESTFKDGACDEEMLKNEGAFKDEEAFGEKGASGNHTGSKDEAGKSLTETQEEPGGRFFGRVKATLLQLKEKIFNLKNSISNIKSILTDETNKKAVSTLWMEVLYLLKHFRFRRIHAELTFSMGDPALTGQALGIFCMLPFLYQYEFRIYPDFESDERYVRGTFDIKGRIRGLHFLVSVIRIIVMKECRMLIKKFLK